MPKKRRKPTKPEDPKASALRAAGALHTSPEKVRDEAFVEHDFLDPRDSVQVKYEMLRCHRVGGRSVTDAASTFGASRQSFYAVKAKFEDQGLPGLLPRRRGPKKAHKCSDDLLDFVANWLTEDGPKDDASMVGAIKHQFAITVHPRSVARALARREKKLRSVR